MTDGVRCMIMRGGSSKGAYFLADELPSDSRERDELLLRIMGSPDARQVDGIGGAHPLTSKVAVVAPSNSGHSGLDYLFLQIGVDERIVTDRQNCGNLLAGVAPFAIERGLLSPADGEVSVRIQMLNSGSVATAHFPIASGQLATSGETSVSGVPGMAAAIRLDFEDIAGSSCGALLPTGHAVDKINGVECTLIDNGMPVVVMRADALGLTGYEECSELEDNVDLRRRLREIRLEAGHLMKLGDVSETTVPKLTMVSPPSNGGDLCTRTFIPHRCHDAIGVFGATSVAAAALLPSGPASEVFRGNADGVVVLEHPSGFFEAVIDLQNDVEPPAIRRAGIVRTARKLMDGLVFPREYR